MRWRWIAIVGSQLLCLTMAASGQVRSPGKSHGEESFLVNWKTYQNYEGMTDILKGLAARFPKLAKLYSTGKSRMGRQLWVMEITNFAKGDTLEKPGFYIDGNIHGNEVNGMMVPLYSCWYLLTRYGHDDFVTDLVDRVVFYIRPSVNPDAMNSFITEPNTMHHPRWNYRPIDNDGDGLYDEDPEEDLNGDGEISLMRKRDPLGRWKISPEDPRLMVRCKPGEPPGGWTLLGTEGIDNDGDGAINEDIPGGLDMARNFPYDYGVQNGWPFPLSEPETKGVIEFFRTHPNINGVFHYHNAGNLIMMALGKEARMETTAPAERRQRGELDLPPLSPEEQKLMEGFLNVTVEEHKQRDLAMYQTLAARGVQILKYRPTLNGGVGQFPPWTYNMYGAPSFLIELWGIPADYNGDGEVSEAEALRWVDEELNGEGWIDWKPFNHPQLGEIEIGGSYAKFVRRSPPARFLEEHCLANTRFHLYVASELPRLEFVRTSITPICSFAKAAQGDVGPVTDVLSIRSGDLKTEKGVLAWLDVEIRNHSVIPTATAQAVKIKATRPDRLRIKGANGVQILGRSDPPNTLGRISGFTTESPSEIEVGYLGGRSSQSYRFLVRVSHTKNGAITLEYDSQRGGVARKTIPVRFVD
ncbi:MAG: M14 family metallopeptidase [candidate division KSB1 bacterium]|nr:M14 family metallopeptidase [candidate division KSB1 bacterium]MDZ7392897.1 M14 family metallopeptidase [candidate division KSB1 bacterium]